MNELKKNSSRMELIIYIFFKVRDYVEKYFYVM